MINLREKLKVDVALPPQSIATTNKTGEYFDLAGYDRALFVLDVAAVALDATATLAIMGNTVAGSSGAAAITDYDAVITSANEAQQAMVHVNTPDNDDAVVINDVTFTKKATKDDDANEFATVADLVAQITAAFPGVLTASVVNTDYALIVQTVPGVGSITITSTDEAKLVPSIVHAQAYVEVPVGLKRWVAAKVTTVGTIICGVTLVRGYPRNLPVAQYVAEGYPD